MEPETTPNPRSSGTAQARELGEELRRLRHRRRLSLEQVTGALGWSPTMLSKVENGARTTSAWNTATLLGALGVDLATRNRIEQLVQEPATGSHVRVHPGRGPDDLPMLAVHEAIAVTVTSYDPFTVPALLQTEDYARIALEHTHDVDTAVRTRLERQHRFGDRSRPTCDGTFYVHERALAGAVGDRVMREQCLRLAVVNTTAQPGLRVRLVPDGVGDALQYPALRQPFTLLTFTDPIRPLAYTETVDATAFTDDAPAVYQTMLADLHRIALTVQHTTAALQRRAAPAGRDEARSVRSGA
ncbi:Scr1 family TA system antitoxin-like transcriptional regulator [Saccharothrix stipae]